MVFKLISNEYSVDWIHLCHYRTDWRALVNNVMNILLPEKARYFLPAEESAPWS
jgi:hypothetical protein